MLARWSSVDGFLENFTDRADCASHIAQDGVAWTDLDKRVPMGHAATRTIALGCPEKTALPLLAVGPVLVDPPDAWPLAGFGTGIALDQSPKRSILLRLDLVVRCIGETKNGEVPKDRMLLEQVARERLIKYAIDAQADT